MNVKESSLEISQRGREIKFTLTVPVEIKKKGKWFIATCHAFQVNSQGASLNEARDNIIEAVQLFIETSYERGILEKVLKECGFHPVSTRQTVAPRELSPTEFMVDVPLPLLVANHAQAQAC